MKLAKKGEASINGFVAIVVAVIFVLSLMPVVQTAITTVLPQLSTTNQAIVALISTFIILGLIALVAKKNRSYEISRLKNPSEYLSVSLGKFYFKGVCKMKNKFMLICSIMVFIFLSVNAFANIIFTDFGGSRTDDLIFSSPYGNGTTNLTVLSEVVGNEYYPHVLSSLDFENDNLLFQYGINQIRVYNSSSLSLLSVLNLGVNITGQPQITNIDNPNKLDLSFVTTNGTHKFINFYTMDNGIDLRLVTDFIIDFNSTGQIGVPKNFCSLSTQCNNTLIAGLLNNGSFEIINITNKNYKVYNTGVSFLNPVVFDSTYPYFSNPIIVDDVVGSNLDEIVIGFLITGDDFRVKIFDFEGNELDDSGVIGASAGTLFDVQIQTAQIGSPTGSKEIIMSSHNHAVPSGAIQIFDSDLNVLYGDASNLRRSTVTVGDFNIDGLNEFCYQESNKIVCVDSTFTNIFELAVENTELTHFLSMANYNNSVNSSYLEIITKSGIWQYNGVSLDIIYNFTSIDNNGMIYPVELRDYPLYTVKDILQVTQNGLYGYYSKTTGAICGNGVCQSPFETILTCPIDCDVTFGVGVVGSSCDSDVDCSSKKCLYGKCALKQFEEKCTQNSQCLSENCQVGECTKPTYFQIVDNAKDETMGNDENSSNFLCMILAGGLFIFVLAGGILAGKAMLGFAVGAGGAFVLLSFFAFIGWLSAWIYISMLLVILAIIIGMILFKGGA